MLKAITVSLLMEQILAPNITFKPRSLLKNGEEVPPGTIIVDDGGEHKVSKEVAEILTNGGLDKRYDICASGHQCRGSNHYPRNQ